MQLDNIFSFKVNWVKYVPVFIILTAYVLIVTYIITGTIALNKEHLIEKVYSINGIHI